MSIRSPLIWIGGKSRMAETIINRMDPHKCYVEVFGGAASVILNKVPVENEVYNDIDGDLVNFYLIARAVPEKLMNACNSLPYSRELFERWKWEEVPDDNFEKAVRFFYLNRSAVAKGNNGHKSGWRHSKSTNTARAYYSSVELFENLANRLKNVMIDNRDFREILRVYDGTETLFYLDPPYIDCEHYYKGNFGEQDHRDLSALLNNIQGKAIISYYDNPLLDELYPKWKRERFETFKQVPSGDSTFAEELLLMNFDNGQLTLF